MPCCLNPSCQDPLNPEGRETCLSCGTILIRRLRERYQLIRPLIGGGFSRTFLAEDTANSNTPSVVKQLVPQLQDADEFQRANQLFQAEVQRLQQLEYPQIPTLYDYFEQDNYFYLVQQWIAGHSLREEIEQQGAFSEQKVWDLLSDLLPALSYIHKQQVIHRDVKPENILRRQSDRKLVLIDFGVAKYLSAQGIPMLGTTLGSFGYAPPEQLDSGETSPKSDFYSLGVTCLHLLTQIPPAQMSLEYGYDWVNNWRQYLKTRPVSQELSQVINKLLQIDNQQQSPIVTDSSGITPPTPPPVEREPVQQNDRESLVVVPAQRSTNFINKKLLWLGIVLLLLGLGGCLYWYWNRQQEPGAAIATLTGHTDEVNTVAFSPDGKQFATGSDDRTIKIWRLSDRKPLRTLAGHLDWIYSVDISSDGRTLVSGAKDNIIKVWNLETGSEIRSVEGHKSYVNSVAVSPNGQVVVSGSYDKTIKILNLQTGEIIRELKGHTGEVLAVAISPDSQRIASGSADTTIKLWDLRSGKVLRTYTGHSDDVNDVEFSSDGEQLASVSDDKTVRIWKLNTGRNLRTLLGHVADVNAVAISPNGEQIASGSDDKTIKLWNIFTAEEVATFREHEGEVWAVAFSPDGRTLVSTSQDSTIKIWQVPQ